MSTLQKSIEYLKPFIRAKSPAKPLIIGIEGPQGSGKTWLATHLKEQLSKLFPSLNFINFSMDDFYLTFQEQCIVNEKNKGNMLLQGRGLPGTHDLDLLKECLLEIQSGENSVEIPVYDKSLNSGKGDRLPHKDWIRIEKDKKVDVLIFEGWFNGYRAIGNTTKLIERWHEIQRQQSPKFDSLTESHIVKLDKDLKKYEEIWKFFDCFIYLTTPRLDNVYTWRLQQEHDLISKKGSGMTDKEVELFVDRYMPAYHLYYHNLSGIENIVPNCRNFEIGIDRQIIHRESNM
ncbi:unnamed protein product [Ambrosiozyma monospora]|uniref:Unnamed protein product n=1 Tax=Ambrosiozyma monospora TaxID=43982 RepID=A0ACB5T4U7_AMBMO|nr:unnamed protein product [Ambrosiozyma monospora]